MKKLSHKILLWLIKWLAQLTIWKYRPGILGVTGSVGKTSTKMVVTAILRAARRVRVSAGNFNNEIGLPLTILSEATAIHGWFFWPKVISRAIWQLLVTRPYPEILILEYGVDKPGDMKYLLQIARPNVSIITAIGQIPVHVEFFSGPAELAREKGRIIEHLPSGGYAILNCDDLTVMDLKDRTRAHLFTFGFSKRADLRITNFNVRAEGSRPIGVSFKLEYAGNILPIRLDNIFGRTQAYAVAAGTAVGLIFGLNLIKIAEALKEYRPPAHRQQLLEGLKDSQVIDDSYNASPLSMQAALETLRALPAKRRIAILGDMLEIGPYALEAHTALGRAVKEVVSVLVTVGPHAKFIAEGARQNGFPKRNIYTFDEAHEAAREVSGLIRKGDLILVKGSRGIHLEKVVEEIVQSNK